MSSKRIKLKLLSNREMVTFNVLFLGERNTRVNTSLAQLINVQFYFIKINPLAESTKHNMRRVFVSMVEENSIISIKHFDIFLKKHIAGVRITNLFVVLSRKFSTAARNSIQKHTHTIHSSWIVFVVVVVVLFAIFCYCLLFSSSFG